MDIRYGYQIDLFCPQQTVIVCLMEVEAARRGDIQHENFSISPEIPQHIYTDGFGNACRRFVAPPGALRLSCDGVLADDGAPDPVDTSAGQTAIADLPDEALQYLLASRYCETDLLGNIAWQHFGGFEPGWERAAAIFEFVHRHLTFGYEHARATRTAAEGYHERVGVCRDFAHLAIALCRCMNMPARYVNGYMGDIDMPPNPAPMDFNAWVEVFLGGRWWTFDARHNRRRIGRIVVARGRDATDIPLIHSFGQHFLNGFVVVTKDVTPAGTMLAAVG